MAAKTRSADLEIAGEPSAILRFYSIGEVRHRLGGVGKTWLYGEVAAGRLKLTKLGTRSMVAGGELQRFMGQLEAGSAYE